MTERTHDVVVIGGGVIGCAVARAIAMRGRGVMVLERAVPGREATWAAGGMLSPLSETLHAHAFFQLSVASLDRYAAFVAALASESGIDVEYRPAGKLHVAFTAHEHARLAALVELGHDFGVQPLSPADARRLVPQLSPDIAGGVFVGRDHRVDNRLLGAAVWKAAEARGVHFRLDSEVTRLAMGRGSAPRVEAVQLRDGSTVAADSVVIAAGAWSGALAGLPVPLPVQPVRGQMFAVDGSADLPLAYVVEAPGCYVIPREDGRLVVGATAERVGFATGPTPAGVAHLMTAATRVLPALGDLPLIETWSGFRPGTPDDLPVLGRDPVVHGLFYATGHYRNGILLAPVTADILAALIMEEEPPVAIAAFRPGRWQQEY